MSEKIDFSAKDILNCLPHRAPFLFVDKVVAMDDVSIETIKQVSFNEPYFQGHFPSRPIMPGVLIIEAMAQSAGVFMVSKKGVQISEERPFYLASVKQARFKQVVIPGDSMHFKIRLDKQRASVWQFTGEAFVNDVMCAQATFINMESSAEQMR
jgi:3-hydroxyacyl-[acyl-carrier-protein] dehydratase